MKDRRGGVRGETGVTDPYSKELTNLPIEDNVFLKLPPPKNKDSKIAFVYISTRMKTPIRINLFSRIQEPKMGEGGRLDLFCKIFKIQ